MPRSCKPLQLTLGAGLALAALTLHAAKPTSPPPQPAPLRVLFVGNSYTYVNDLPDVVAAVAAARGYELVAGMLAEPDFAIQDHLRQPDYGPMLDLGWDWVVLQQGPSSLPENQENLRVWSGRAADLARARGIRVALWSAWPALDNAHTWAAAELSYRNAARANNLCVFPVATAWRLARERAPGLSLYDHDRLHPDRPGTLLAAMVLAQGLVPRPHQAQPPDMTPHLEGNEWRAARNQTALLDTLAREALGVEPARCYLQKSAAQRP